MRRQRRRALSWLNATQFLGSLNDNMVKSFVQMFLISALPDSKCSTLAWATVFFAAPYLFFAPLGGFLSERFSKKTVTVVFKYAELATMLLTVPAFILGWRWLLFFLLFLQSSQNALFSPVKYRIIPELVSREKLSQANSVFVVFSFVGVIVGAALAPMLAGGVHSVFPSDRGAYALVQLVCVALAFAGVLLSHNLWRLKPSNPGVRPDRFYWRNLVFAAKRVFSDRNMGLATGAIGLFSMTAAFLQINLVRYGMEILGRSVFESTFLYFYAALGIAAGAFAAGRLSLRDIEFGLMPMGGFVLSAATLAVGAAGGIMPLPVVYAAVFAAGFGAGLFKVPLDTIVQLWTPREFRQDAAALNDVMSWSGVVCAGVLMMVFGMTGISADAAFIIMTLPGMLLALGSFFSLKDFAFRFFVKTAVRLLYRVRALGIENMPEEGPALLIANHASYMDSLLISATLNRRVRFMMSRERYDKFRFLRPLFDLYGVIPISGSSSPRQTAEALRAARKALEAGYVVCVFPEGEITRTGTIRAFKRGFEKIMRGTNFPLIPVYMGGSWGTIYHYYRGQLVRRWFRMSLSRYRVTVVYGKPLPPDTDAFHVRRAVMELSCDYFNARKCEHNSLAKIFIGEARRNWRDEAATDTMGMKLTWGKVLIAGVILARKIGRRVASEQYVGVLLPTCCAGMIANVAVALLGRAVVNLNFTTSKSAFASSIEQCGMKTIITSRSFLERFPQLPIPAGAIVYIEDILKGAGTWDKLTALFAARFLPLRLMVRQSRPTSADDVVMVLFSSGSTGEPKGVLLSHHNVISMIESLRMMLATTVKDHICGALPLFHSFGIMGTVWYPLLTHVRVTMHTNPLDAQMIVDIVREHSSTMLFGTPTFLSIYMRKATREDFKSLRFVLAGAEKLKESLVNAYITKFGIRPYEAYGATELSPGIAVSVPHGEGGGEVQEGWRTGRVGLPCPGVAMKVLDPDTGEEMPPGEPGLLYLKGPNLMLGYLGRSDLTSEVVSDGWYCTGDIAFIDDDGFVGLTDRLSRFSKIGGEMVPHVGVEEALMNAAGLSGVVLAVAGVPDEKKGEKLVVLYTPECGDAERLWQLLDKSDVPNLWKPSKSEYYLVDAIPVLGTGKMDLAGVKALARRMSAGKTGNQEPGNR